MARFDGSGRIIPALTTVLFDDFAALRPAREEQDALLETYFGSLTPETLHSSFAYVNKGKDYVETAPMAFSYFFNHQTHHQAQIHVMSSKTPVAPPSLDLHRIVNP